MRSKFKWIFTLLVALTVQLSFAQEKTVTGRVSDASGPLPGANVVVKETKAGVQTDVDGKYSIKVSQGQTLVFSFVGMSDSEVKVGASSTVNATLSEGLLLGEVVVTGALGIQKKMDAQTATQQVVKNEELTRAAQPNAVLALVGKVSGLQINTTNTGVNSTTRVVLRGTRSLTQSNEALIVIDNAVSSLAAYTQLPPDMIESVNVIKGAQGAALYGQQGGNGVIVVTTKKGAKGSKPVVQLTSSIDFEEISFVPQRQRRYGQGWAGQHVNYENGAWGAEFDGVPRATGLMQADGTYVTTPYRSIKDNIKEFFQTGTISQSGVSISAGDSETGYATFLANRQATDFVVDGDQLKRNAFVFRAGKKLGKWSIDGNASYTSQNTQTTSAALYTELLQAATNIPVERFARPFNQYHWTSYYNSPYWTRENIRNESRQDRFRGVMDLGYTFNKNINARYTFNVNTIQSQALSYANGYTDLLQVGGGNHTVVSSFDTSNSMARNIYADFLVNFDYKLTEKIGFKFNVGNNIRDDYFSSSAVGGDNLTVPGLYNVSNVTGIPRASNTRTRFRAAAVFANLDLDYNEWIFLNVTARNDWTSRLDVSNNSFFYPSVGVSFVPTQAFEALKDNKILSHAKIYANVVKNGNDGSTGFASIFENYVQATGYAFGDLNSFVQSSSATFRYLKPEFYVNKEIGINLEFLEGRISLDASYFRSDNTDLITGITPSYASGLTNLTTNIGEAHTTGGEIDLGFTPIDTKDFGGLGLKWTNRLGYSRAITKVDKVSDQTDEVALANFTTSGGIGIFATKGEEFPLIKGIGYERDDQGRVIIDPTTGNPLKTTEYIKLGKSTPDYILTYNTQVQFKGFALSATMDYRTGHQFYSATKQWLSWSGHLYDSALTGRSGFVFPNSSYDDGTGNFVPNTGILTGGTTYGSYLSYYQDEYAETAENFVLDATAFKVRELALSYSFQRETLDRLGLTQLRLGVNARNPFMVFPKENRNYSDPEQSRSSGNDQGIAATGQYPVTRTYGFSINVTF